MQLIHRFPLLFLTVVLGCAENNVRNIVDLVVPDAIDIGQVRGQDSPVRISFSMTNRSSVPVEIDKIQSGCGCTVIDLPQKIIRPSETIEVPVKIDLFGRKGDFNTDLLVRSTLGESWRIRINGKVMEDIWYVGQSIRFYINQDQKVVSKDFIISTVDYPGIRFEFGTSDPDICLSELSRSSQGGETNSG